MAWAAFLTDDELERHDLTQPFIKPQQIMTDNGQCQRGHAWRESPNKRVN